MEVRVKTKSGEIRHLEVAEGSTPIHEKGKFIVEMISSFDITERKREGCSFAGNSLTWKREKIWSIKQGKNIFNVNQCRME